MNLDRALERARAAKTPKQAATLYNDIEYELTWGEPTSAQDRDGEQALSELEGRFPDVKRAAREVDTPAALSRAAKENLDAGGGAPDRSAEGAGRGTREPRRRRGASHPGSSSSRGRRGGHPPSTSSTGSRPSSSGSWPSPSSSSSGGSSSGPGLGDLIPGGGFDATDTALGLLRLILLLGVGYFVLTPRGANALGVVLSGITGGVRRIISPIDPLGSAPASSAPSSPAPLTAQQVNTATGAVAQPGQTGTNLNTGNNPRGVAIPQTPPPLTASAVNIATGALGSHVRQSIGPYGGGSIR